MSLRDGTDRYRVVRTGFWWRVRIGDGQQTVGRCYTETEAQRLAAALLTAYRDGVFVAEQSAKARRPALPPGERMVVVPVRLTEAQKAKLQRIGAQRLREWLDRVREPSA